MREIRYAMLNFVLLASSSLFLSLPIGSLFEIEDYHAIFGIFFLLLLFFNSNYGFKKFKRFGQYFTRIIKILGSIAFLFLFVNYYFKIFNFPTLEFLKEKIEWESFFNILALSIVLTLGSFVIYFYLASLILNFILDRIKIERRKKTLELIGWIVMLLPLLFLAISGINIRSLSFQQIMSIYSVFRWIFGFSLFFIHLNYLVQEARVFLEARL